MFKSFKSLQHLAALLVLAALVTGCSDGADSPKVSADDAFYPAAEDEWVLEWSDEFDGNSLDTSNWDIQTGDGSDLGLIRWGNNEQQWYTADNLTVAYRARNEYPYGSLF